VTDSCYADSGCVEANASVVIFGDSAAVAETLAVANANGAGAWDPVDIGFDQNDGRGRVWIRAFDSWGNATDSLPIVNDVYSTRVGAMADPNNVHKIYANSDSIEVRLTFTGAGDTTITSGAGVPVYDALNTFFNYSARSRMWADFSNIDTYAGNDSIPFDNWTTDQVDNDGDWDTTAAAGDTWDPTDDVMNWPEPFVDEDGDGVFDLGEEFWDLNTGNPSDSSYTNKVYDIGDGNFDPNELPELFVACNEDGPCKFFTSLLTVAVDADTTYLIRLGGFGFETGSGTISFEFVPDAASCGEPDAGTCCEAQAGPFCAEGDCCEAVCAIDPACCDELWDASCADLAFTACTPLCGTPPANDECEGAIPLVAGVNIVENINASTGAIQPPDAQCTFFGSSTINNDVWFTYASACDGPVILSLCPGSGGSATFDTKLAVWSGPDCDNLSIVGCNDDTCGTRSEVIFDAVCGQVYFIQFGAWASQGEGTGELILSCVGETCDNPADLNGDGVVDGADLTILLAAWGTDNTISDLNGDGIVDGADLTILLAAWS